MSWQTEALRVVTETALGMGAVRVVPVGSLATHDLDRWSDLDALIVVPDGRLAQFWPDRGWLQPLGEVAAYETSKHPEDASIRLLLAAGRRVDVLVAEQRSVETRLARLADTIPVVDAATIAAAGDRLIFEAATVVGHAARGERLIATTSPSGSSSAAWRPRWSSATSAPARVCIGMPPSTTPSPTCSRPSRRRRVPTTCSISSPQLSTASNASSPAPARVLRAPSSTGSSRRHGRRRAERRAVRAVPALSREQVGIGSVGNGRLGRGSRSRNRAARSR